MRKWFFGAGLVLAIALTWYLFVKSFDYLVMFKVKALAGTVNQTAKIWVQSLENSSVISQDDITHFKTQIAVADSLYVYDWKLEQMNDSTTWVKVYASDDNHSLQNRLLIPFIETDFEKRTKSMLLDYSNLLTEHIKEFSVRIEGEASLPSAYCACTSLKGKQSEKAFGMMKDYPLLNSILVDAGAVLDGRPRIQVTRWDINQDYIEFDFCYPVKEADNLPVHPDITYKKVSSDKAIKAVYNGNYISSDRAWYALLNYAVKNGLTVSGMPVEVFFNNPNMGGDALRWKAEVYMPITEVDD